MPYLAMTAAEFRSSKELPEKMGWMACHFSSYGLGLSNLPTTLPEGSLLILNDRTPVRGHDGQKIYDQLAKTIDSLKCEALLLDLQRESTEAVDIISKLLTLPCPVIVSERYAKDFDWPVFLPPVPLLQPVAEYIAPWKGREIWLEAALDGMETTVTENGSFSTPLPSRQTPDCSHHDEELHCHYRIAVTKEKAIFTLRRTEKDLGALLKEAKKYGVTNAVGLYQELSK